MKNIKAICVLLMLGTFVLISCSDDDGENLPTTPSNPESEEPSEESPSEESPSDEEDPDDGEEPDDEEPESTPDPIIIALEPAEAFVGEKLTIRGEHLTEEGVSTRVFFTLNILATIVASETRAITVVVPPGAESGAVSLRRGEVEHRSAQLFSLLQPSILSFEPQKSGPGREVALDWYGPPAPQADIQVWLGDLEATVQSATDNSLTFIVPEGAKSGPVGLVLSGQRVKSEEPLAILRAPLYFRACTIHLYGIVARIRTQYDTWFSDGRRETTYGIRLDTLDMRVDTRPYPFPLPQRTLMSFVKLVRNDFENGHYAFGEWLEDKEIESGTEFKLTINEESLLLTKFELDYEFSESRIRSSSNEERHFRGRDLALNTEDGYSYRAEGEELCRFLYAVSYSMDGTGKGFDEHGESTSTLLDYVCLPDAFVEIKLYP